MSTYIHKRHNVSVLLCHAVCPAKYRRVVSDEPVDVVLRWTWSSGGRGPPVDVVLRWTCLDIAARYEVTFIKIDTNRDHVHFLMQSVPTLNPSSLVQRVKRQLWGGAFWSSGFFVNTVGRYGSEETIRQYV